MLKFDLDLFWMLPRIENELTDNKGGYCALGAAGKALGYEDNNLAEALTFLSDGYLDDIANINDSGYTYNELKEARRNNPGVSDDIIIKEMGWKPNHEKAKRLLLEMIRDEVNFVSKELSLDSLPSLSEV